MDMMQQFIAANPYAKACVESIPDVRDPGALTDAEHATVYAQLAMAYEVWKQTVLMRGSI
jgi:hypothetical protein